MAIICTIFFFCYSVVLPKKYSGTSVIPKVIQDPTSVVPIKIWDSTSTLLAMNPQYLEHNSDAPKIIVSTIIIAILNLLLFGFP